MIGVDVNKGLTQHLRFIIVVLLLLSTVTISTAQTTTVDGSVIDVRYHTARGAVKDVYHDLVSVANITYNGVNRSGTGYQCTKSWGSTFDGPSDQASVRAMVAWKIYIVRIPLNEDCWLGINGEPADKTTAKQYRQDIVNYVKLLQKNHMIVIVELHWNAPGNQRALQQQPMPDADHALSFWSSVASTFKGNGTVLFDLYNEPHTNSWLCWRNGSSGAYTPPCDDVGFAVAGMQTLVTTIRNTGANNAILLSGLAHANDITGWLQNVPSDPSNNLAAALHIYPTDPCYTIDCLDAQIASVQAQYPVIVTELGEFDCGHSYIDGIMPWLDSRHIDYLGWAWNARSCTGTPALIRDYNGTPTAYGIGFKNHLASI